MFTFCFNLGVWESGTFCGALTFIVNGIGKSTPTRSASPSPKLGKKDRLFLFAADAAFSTAFYLVHLSIYEQQTYPFDLVFLTEYLVAFV